MLLRTSSSGEELELFVFLEEELGVRDVSLGAPLCEELSREQRTRLFAWLAQQWGVRLGQHELDNKEETTFMDVVEMMAKRQKQDEDVPPPLIPVEEGRHLIPPLSHVVPPLLTNSSNNNNNNNSCNDLSLRFLSYNVNYSLCRAVGGSASVGKAEDVIVNAILSSNADIVLLQETHASWRAHLASCGLDAKYKHRWFHDDNAASGGLALYSRFPIVATELIETPLVEKGSWFPLAVSLLLVGNDELLAVANVHLRPALEDDGSGSLTAMHTTSQIRVRELQRALASSPDVPLAICGDFNEEDRFSACAMLREIGMKDALALTESHTHWWVLNPGRLYLRKRLDHLFATSELQWTNCRVLEGCEGNASDHLPVVADGVFSGIKFEQLNLESLAQWLRIPSSEREELEMTIRAMIMSKLE